MPKRYRCSIAIAIAVCLQLATGTAKAAETTYTANDLLQDCKGSLLERKVPPRPFYSGLCMDWSPERTTWTLRAARQKTRQTAS